MLATVAKLIARRLLAAIPILLIVSALLFCVLRLLPVDPAAMSLPPTATSREIEAKRREMGLDRPLPRAILDLAPRRAAWRFRPLHSSSAAKRRIACRRNAAGNDRARRCARWSLPPVSASAAACCCFSLRGTWFESVADLGSILLLSIPEFLWGLILLFVFGVVLQRAAVHRARSRRICRSRTSPALFCSTLC